MRTPAAVGCAVLFLSVTLLGCGSSDGTSSSSDPTSAEGVEDTTSPGDDGAEDSTSPDADSSDAPTEAGMEEALTVVGITASSITVDDGGWVIDIPADQGDPAAYAESTCVNARLYISGTDPDGSSGVATAVEVTVDGAAAATWSGDFADQCAAAD